MPRKKINTADWRNLPIERWNVRTFIAYFADRNRELFGCEAYLPMRNWSFEQGVLKRAIEAHGPAKLKAAFDVAFREYRPTREYPYMTAGFAVCYRINSILPRLRGSYAQVSDKLADVPDYDAVRAWL